MDIWPSDADGNVFRSLQEQNFDFSKEYAIDFNIDFDRKPAVWKVISELGKCYPEASVADKTDFKPPYIQVTIRSHLHYDFVIKTQKSLSAFASKFHGWCDSWGILHDS